VAVGIGVAVGVAPHAARAAETAERADSFRKLRRPRVFSDMVVKPPRLMCSSKL
jgi:hypothetical protein